MKRFIVSSMIFSILSMISGIMNLGFNILAARLFGPVAYGTISSLMAMVTLVSTPTAAIGLATAGWTADAADSPSDLRNSLAPVRLVMLCTGALIVFAVYLFRADVSRALRVTDALFVVIAIIAVIPGYTGSAIMGALQGLKKFFAAGASAVLGSLAKLIALFVGVILGGTVLAGTAALVAGSVVSWLVSEFSVRSQYQHPISDNGAIRQTFAWSRYKGLLRKVVGTSALTAGGTVFLNVDILLAKHFLIPNAAGLFAALGSSGRIILFATGGIPSVLYPSLVSGKNPPSSLRLLLLGQGVTACVSLVACVVYATDPALVVTLLFGHQFLPITRYLFYYGLGFSFYAMASIFLVYLLYQQTKWIWAYAVLGGGVEAAILSVWHYSILQFTFGILAFFISLFLVSGFHVTHLILRTRKELV